MEGVDTSKKVDHDLRMFDIAANLSDESFQGIYHGKKAHEPDFEVVMNRARQYGVEKFLFSAGYIEDAVKSYDLATKSEDYFMTIGVHPCRATEVYKDEGTVETYHEKIEKTIEEHFVDKSKLVAVGECGLDYDRFHYADKDSQMAAFPFHFDMAEKYNLPMYLHSRATGLEFIDIVKKNRDKFPTGVVHSYTGDEEELKEILELDLYVGINGCSLKTEENCEIVKKIPLDRLMLETDCPYCDIRNSHFSSQYVKTKIPKVAKKKYNPEKMCKERNEPCTMIQVLEAVAGIKDVSEKEVAEAAWENTMKMFKLE
ncbi:unnamed protein product [Moneuplotes crassus]|uniref:Uncharacterized protein n=1 Tax=Euplotes crassus TaxID=5936 RepID=A0AAD1XJH9_EUPCR|nr:unnamed protein product [Moneuplotes crassus]